MTSSDHLRRLHFINALFAGLTGHDLYLAQQIQAAITTSLAAEKRQPPVAGDPAEPDDPAFTAAATRLLERLCDGRQDYGFFH